MLSIKCPNCGGTIHFDKDHVITFCSFCGSHLPDMTEYVKQATQLEIQEKKHAMEMETLQKEIRKERAKSAPQRIRSTAEIVRFVVLGIVMLPLIILLFIFMFKLYT